MGDDSRLKSRSVLNRGFDTKTVIENNEVTGRKRNPMRTWGGMYDIRPENEVSNGTLVETLSHWTVT